LNAFVELTTTRPAQIYGLHPKKGTIAAGADADLAIWDPFRKVTIKADGMHDRTGYTPFEGTQITGWPTTVILRGGVAIADGECRIAPGIGRFIKRAPLNLSGPEGPS
jgi:dihydropyrimidinase